MIDDPALTPVINPVEFIVTDPLLLLQTPPAVVLVNCIVEPIQTDVDPVIEFTIGIAFMVTVVVIELVQPKEVTV